MTKYKQIDSVGLTNMERAALSKKICLIVLSSAAFDYRTTVEADVSETT